MRTIIISLLAIVLWHPILTIDAFGEDAHRFFKAAIEQEIEQCLHKSRFIYSRGDNLQRYGQQSLDQAIFFHENKELIVQAMVYDNTPQKAYAIDYFMGRFYREHADQYANRRPNVTSGYLLTSDTSP